MVPLVRYVFMESNVTAAFWKYIVFFNRASSKGVRKCRCMVYRERDCHYIYSYGYNIMVRLRLVLDVGSFLVNIGWMTSLVGLSAVMGLVAVKACIIFLFLLFFSYYFMQKTNAWQTETSLNSESPIWQVNRQVLLPLANKFQALSNT